MKKLVLAAATAAAMLVSGAAQADTVNYATFGQLPGGTKVIDYVNSGPNPGGVMTNNGTQQVMFWFTGADLPPVLTGPQIAYFNLNAVSTTAASVNDGDVKQTFQTGTLSFIRTTPSGVGSGNGDNLLSITFTNFVLKGELQSDAPTGSASTLSSSATSAMTITSDFYDFSGLTSSNFSFSMTAALPTLSIAQNGAIGSFQANASGLFASNPAPVYVPEPGMLGLFGAGAFGLALARRRTK